MAERKKLLLRLDPQVYEAVARWAADDLRSVNAQIEYALRLALKNSGREPRAARAADPSGASYRPDDPGLSGDPDPPGAPYPSGEPRPPRIGTSGTD